VLDAGGGTGDLALALAGHGCRVCLLDSSPGMLARAARRLADAHPGVAGRVETCCARAEEVATALAGRRFDVVCCHTLLEYLPDPAAALEALSGVLRPGGLLSVVLVHPPGDALRAAARGDLETVRHALAGEVSGADLFGLPRTVVPLERLRGMLDRLGLTLLAERGVRTFSDLLPPDRLEDPAFFDEVLSLEEAAAPSLASVARYVHLLARRADR